MESERVVPRRYVIGGALLVGGFLVGLWLVATFRWFPYFWQWLAYHTGVVVVVLIYLLVSAFSEEVPRDAPRAYPRPYRPRAELPPDRRPTSWWTAGGPAYWGRRASPGQPGAQSKARDERAAHLREPFLQPPTAPSIRSRRSPPRE